uniref:REJ domain-containing protein n=1 Tax=Ditylenchus dipsaci TaxID=166011 RepID=A0A915D714_9BILA
MISSSINTSSHCSSSSSTSCSISSTSKSSSNSSNSSSSSLSSSDSSVSSSISGKNSCFFESCNHIACRIRHHDFSPQTTASSLYEHLSIPSLSFKKPLRECIG